MTLQMDVQTDGGGYHNIPAFSSKSAGIMMEILLTGMSSRQLNIEAP